MSEDSILFENILLGNDSVSNSGKNNTTAVPIKKSITNIEEVKDDDYDPFAVIERAIDSDFDSSIFDMIDDSDLPLAKNWFEFCTKKKFLGLEPFPKQIKFGLEFFSDYCPDCSHPDIMEDLFDQSMGDILDHVQLLECGICPKCKRNRLEFIKDGKLSLYNELAGCAGQRSGKAQPLHCKIKIPKGWVTMGDVKLGQEICIPDGDTAKVIKIHPQGLRPTYRITFEDGRATECDENHLWKVFNEHWKRSCVRVKGGGYTYPKRDNPWKVFSLKELLNRKSKQPLFISLTYYLGEYKELPLNPYILGSLLGDGNFTSTGVRFSTSDLESVNNLERWLSEGYYIKKENNRKYDYRITHGMDGVPNYYKDALKNLNLWGEKAWEKFIPKEYLESSVEQRLELIRGLMDTDGTVSKKRCVSYTSTSYQLALDMQYLIRSIGGLCKLKSRQTYYTHKGERKNGRISYRLNIRHETPEILFNLTRKKERAKRIKSITLRCKIKNIEYLGEQETQCITINHPDNLYITDNFIVTHNSVWVAMTACYQLHRFLKLPNPSHYFKLLKNTMLHMIFVAITYKQAADTLWEPFRSYYDDSPWFKEYHKMLDYYGEKVGKPFYDIKATYIRYDHKKLTAYALGPDKRKLRGRTGFFCSVDELGWFHGADKAVKLNPDQICKALENSLQTLRSACEIKRDKFKIINCPDALFINISSPSAANDKIMRLVRESASNRYAFHLPTWEMNPMITRKSLEPRFRDNPIAAERDFGANPPLSDAPYISNPETVRNVIHQEIKNKCKYSTIYSQDSLKHTTLKVKNFLMKDLDRSVNYVLGIDTGHSKNAFAVVLQHYNCSNKCAVVDLALEIRPEDGFTIHFPAMFNMVIKPITDKARVALVVFDKWQSINYEDELHDLGIEADRYSLKHEDFVTIRGYLFSMKITLPRPELDFEEIINPIKEYPKFLEGKPISHLIYQMLTVRDLGRMVTKGLGVDDDVFRAWCLGIKYLFDPKWEKIFHLPAIKGKGKKALGVVVGKSSAGIQPPLNQGVAKGSMDVVLGTIRSLKNVNGMGNVPKFNKKNY